MTRKTTQARRRTDDSSSNNNNNQRRRARQRVAPTRDEANMGAAAAPAEQRNGFSMRRGNVATQAPCRGGSTEIDIRGAPEHTHPFTFTVNTQRTQQA